MSTRIELSRKGWLSPRRALLDELSARHRRALEERLVGQRHRLASRIAQLDALSPLSVLSRGYAIALSERTGRALLAPADARAGDRLRIKLHTGEVHAEVIE